MDKAFAPTIQHLPIPRATTAAWLVIPPVEVKIPSQSTIPWISSGEVSCLTKITFSPATAFSCTFSAVKYTLPAPAPGEAGNPSRTGSADFNASAVKLGCNN